MIAGKTLGVSIGLSIGGSATALATAAPEQAPLYRETQLGDPSAPLTAAVRVEDVEREVGAPIPCSIRFTGVDAASVVIGAIETLGEFDVLAVHPAPRGTGGSGGEAATVELVLSTLASGAIAPAPLEVRWLHDGREMSGKVEFPTLSVKSLLGEEIDPTRFRDIAGIIEIPSPLDWLPWIAGAVAVAAASAGAWWLLRRRTGTPQTPDEWALGELARLERAGLPERAAFGLYYDELTATVRRYVALRYRIPAEQQTSREFIDAARGHAEFPPDEAERLRVLLRLADLVKFAHAEPTRSECDANLVEARAFIEHTRAPNAQEPVGAHSLPGAPR